MWQHPNRLEKGRFPVHDASMTEKHPKRPRDLNQWAKHMVDLATMDENEIKARAAEIGAGVEAKPTKPVQKPGRRGLSSEEG